jgi:inosose dehydratase
MSLEVRIGINPISWMNDDLPELGGETPLSVALSEGSQIGYQGFELGNKFPKDPAALREALAPYKLACVSGWYSGRLASRSVEAEIRAVEGHLRLIGENGATAMVYGEVQDSIQGEIRTPLSKRPRLKDAAGWKAYGERLTAFGRHLLERGVRLAYHHHMGAYVQAPEDVDRLMSATGEEVGLLFDSGHATFGGADAVALLEKHAARVCHVHCKDVRPKVMQQSLQEDWSFLGSVLKGVFTVPGDGSLDFARMLAILDKRNYRGWLVVEAEQDPKLAPPYQYAKKGFEHLKGIVASLKGGRPGAA